MIMAVATFTVASIMLDFVFLAVFVPMNSELGVDIAGILSIFLVR